MVRLGNGVVGILKEDHNKWERRAPLTPTHCGRLLHGGGVERIIVQPCTKRIYRDFEYEDAGCQIFSDLSECGLILGVKQPKLGTLFEDKAYAFFSHTHKAQPENMQLLDEVLRKRVVLYDYELIVGEDGRRLVAFGEYAGRAGMIDFLRGLGEKLLSLGYSTPFLSLGSSYMYLSLSAAKAAVLAVGDAISSSGLPTAIGPLIFVFTGSGKVSQGAQEILRLLPHSYIDPSDLHKLCEKESSREVYACVVTAEHMVKPKDPDRMFDKEDYYAHPKHYKSVFHETVAPYASVIVNCMYWEHRFPQLLTNQQLRDMFIGEESKPRLMGVADITCDVGGSIECLKTTTTIEKPFFRYNPVSGSYHEDLDGEGIFFLAVDILPTEFAKEATKHFGNVLCPFLSSMARIRNPEDESSVSLGRACIAYNGKLTTLYEYIHRLRQSDTRLARTSDQKFRTLVSLSGHLFDKFLINEALDMIEEAGGKFILSTCEIGQTVDAISYAEIEVTAESEDTLAQIIDSMSVIANRSDATEDMYSKISKAEQGLSDKPVNVLVLGAGRMCEPTVKYLSGNEGILDGAVERKVSVSVASLFLEDALKVTNDMDNTKAVQLDVMDDQQLRNIISKADAVISLLPPDFHVRVARICIELRTHLVTASYVSKEMAALHSEAERAGITLLCEMGLDPGIDHMMAMKMIDSAHQRGGKVESFVSYCGGLPSPAAANNPLGYKFSWNPSGALKAGRNPAIYKRDSKIIQVKGEELFASAVPFRIPYLPAFALEILPNRDSLMYGDLYGISEEAATIFRATLRYEGFGKIMDVIGKLGFFNTATHPLLLSGQATHGAFLDTLIQENKITNDSDSLQKALTCLRFLGLDREEKVSNSCKTPFDVLCSQMEKTLVFKTNEQDMVVLHHEVKIVFEDGRSSEKQSTTLLAIGEANGQSAMARSVGLTVAIGAELLLSGTLKSRGVVRPIGAEVYLPVLEMLAALGLRLEENVEKVA